MAFTITNTLSSAHYVWRYRQPSVWTPKPQKKLVVRKTHRHVIFKKPKRYVVERTLYYNFCRDNFGNARVLSFRQNSFFGRKPSARVRYYKVSGVHGEFDKATKLQW